MIVYLMRHGTAESPGTKPDGARRLTPEGEREIRAAAAGLAAAGIVFEKVYTSPLVRAQRTAGLVAAAQASVPEVETADWLESGAPVEAMYVRLKRLAPSAGALLVGHEPDMGTLTARLLGSSGGSVRFQPGTIVRLEFDGRTIGESESPGQLAWVLTAALAASLAGA